MVNDGISAGLKFWLVFLAVFFLIGYSAVASVCYGALAGLAGGFIASYLKSKSPMLAIAKPVESQDNAFKRAQDRLRNRFRNWRELGIKQEEQRSKKKPSRKFGNRR